MDQCHDDWRLPNKNELESLVDITAASAPSIKLAAFPGTPTHGIYWSSTPYSGTAGTAWYFFFDHPLGNFNVLSTLNAGRLVRGGAAADSFGGF